LKCAPQKNSQKITKIIFFEDQGRSRSCMLIPLKSLLSVFVMISSMTLSVPM